MSFGFGFGRALPTHSFANNDATMTRKTNDSNDYSFSTPTLNPVNHHKQETPFFVQTNVFLPSAPTPLQIDAKTKRTINDNDKRTTKRPRLMIPKFVEVPQHSAFAGVPCSIPTNSTYLSTTINTRNQEIIRNQQKQRKIHRQFTRNKISNKDKKRTIRPIITKRDKMINEKRADQRKMNRFEEILAIQLPALPKEGILLLNDSAARQLTSEYEKEDKTIEKQYENIQFFTLPPTNPTIKIPKLHLPILMAFHKTYLHSRNPRHPSTGTHRTMRPYNGSTICFQGCRFGQIDVRTTFQPYHTVVYPL